MEASSVPALLFRSRPPVPAARLRLCSDDQLVERFRAGRDEAFAVIHDRYRSRLLAYVRQMLAGRSSEDVEDVLQDVFERAARKLRAEDGPLGLRAWLYSVAHNRCIDELRRRPPASPDVFAASRQPAGDTSAVAERRAEVERLFRDLRALPELQRSALLMRELQGLSHVELAQALDVSVPAIKSLIVRARGGLADAEDARAVPCATIRDDLASAYDRRVKASAQSARHLRECTSCRSYRLELRRTSRRLAALVPGPTLFPLGVIGRLLGGSSVHAKAPVVATGITGSGGAAVAGAGKLAALLGVAAVVTTGAVLERNGSLNGLPWLSSPGVHHAVATPLPSGAVTNAAARSHRAHAQRSAPVAGSPVPPDAVGVSQTTDASAPAAAPVPEVVGRAPQPAGGPSPYRAPIVSTRTPAQPVAGQQSSSVAAGSGTGAAPASSPPSPVSGPTPAGAGDTSRYGRVVSALSDVPAAVSKATSDAVTKLTSDAVPKVTSAAESGTSGSTPSSPALDSVTSGSSPASQPSAAATHLARGVVSAAQP